MTEELMWTLTPMSLPFTSCGGTDTDTKSLAGEDQGIELCVEGTLKYQIS
jgi:hypothetical protein